SRRRHTRSYGDWSSDVCSSDLDADGEPSQVIRSGGMRVRMLGHLTADQGAAGLPATLGDAPHDRLDLTRIDPSHGDVVEEIEGRSEERRVGKECREKEGGEAAR